MSKLEILAHHRDALLLAEAIGWLHDYRKCSDEQLRVQAANPHGSALPRSEGSDPNSLSSRYSVLESTSLQIPVQAHVRTITNLLNDKTWETDTLGKYLSRCHNTAHFDKQDPVGGKQNYPGIQISSPFGFERDVPDSLTNKLWQLPWVSLASYSQAERSKLLKDVRALFSQVGADTRRPINEVDLWGWGSLVAALYKTALAGTLLSSGAVPAARDLRWRLLSVRVDGLAYLLNIVRLPDLLGRHQLLHDGLDRVRCLLEETYPLGNEVYRDENGSLYVVADTANLLGLTDSQGATLHQLIRQEFAKGTLKSNSALQLGGEIVPELNLETQSWWGQDPDWKTKKDTGQPVQNELPTIGALLAFTPRSQPDVAAIVDSWNSRVADVCTVCGLRPQGPGKKAIERNVCDICEQRRTDRSQTWAMKQTSSTIWLDEVADTNARLALVVGQFDLTAWLEGSLLDSLLVRAPHDPDNNTGKAITKTPSFSRIQRIWQTTRQFWHEINAVLAQSLSDDRRRLLLYLDQEPDLGPFHVYDFDLGSSTLSVVWYPRQADGSGGYLISADNLSAVARQLGAEPDIYRHTASAAIWLEDYVHHQFIQGTRPILLHNPEAPPGERHMNLLDGRRIIRTEHQDTSYATAIPILTEPRIFMTLVPADQSLQIVGRIKLKYERELGKVRNRLPLHLSVVYFHRRTPLRAALDAGQSMVQRAAPSTLWKVRSVYSGTLPAERCELGCSTQHFQQTITLILECNGRCITWYVPAVMGDGTTLDNWYPYVFFKQDKDGNTQPASRQRVFKDTSGNWLLHAGDLQPGDQIFFAPATFDFEFLDTTARRFAIYYDANGRRMSRRTRPFYLEDLDRLQMLWNIVKMLTRSQRQQIIRTIEATREAWYGADSGADSLHDAVFRQFVTDTLAGAAWPGQQRWDANTHTWVSTTSHSQPGGWQSVQEWHDQLVQAGVSGELTDLAELHMEILKER